MAATEIRTYETFQVHWANGTRVGGYDTRASAQAVVDFAAGFDGREGWVVARRFTVEVPARYAHLYRPSVTA